MGNTENITKKERREVYENALRKIKDFDNEPFHICHHLDKSYLGCEIHIVKKKYPELNLLFPKGFDGYSGISDSTDSIKYSNKIREIILLLAIQLTYEK